MNVLKLIVLCALMFVLSIGLGMVILSFIKAQKEKVTRTYTASALLLGACVLLFMFGILVFVSLLLKESFLFVYKVSLLCLFVMILAVGAIALCLKRTKLFIKGQLALLKGIFKEQAALREFSKSAAVFVICYLLLVAVYVCHRPLLETRFNLPERVSTMDESNVLYGVNPLTGAMEGVENKGLVTIFSESFFPVFYLLFIRLFQISVREMLFYVVPLFVVCLCMCAYTEIARVVFENDSQKIKQFIMIFTIFTLCGNKAYMNPSYGLLHYAYEETTWLSSVFLPCIFVLLIKGMNRLCDRKKAEKE